MVGQKVSSGVLSAAMVIIGFELIRIVTPVGWLILVTGAVCLVLGFIYPFRKPGPKGWMEDSYIRDSAKRLTLYSIAVFIVSRVVDYFILDRTTEEIIMSITVAPFALSAMYLYVRFGMKWMMTERSLSRITFAGLLGCSLTLLGLFVIALAAIYPALMTFKLMVMSAVFLAPGLFLIYLNYRSRKTK